MSYGRLCNTFTKENIGNHDTQDENVTLVSTGFYSCLCPCTELFLTHCRWLKKILEGEKKNEMLTIDEGEIFFKIKDCWSSHTSVILVGSYWSLPHGTVLYLQRLWPGERSCLPAVAPSAPWAAGYTSAWNFRDGYDLRWCGCHQGAYPCPPHCALQHGWDSH